MPAAPCLPPRFACVLAGACGVATNSTIKVRGASHASSPAAHASWRMPLPSCFPMLRPPDVSCLSPSATPCWQKSSSLLTQKNKVHSPCSTSRCKLPHSLAEGA